MGFDQLLPCRLLREESSKVQGTGYSRGYLTREGNGDGIEGGLVGPRCRAMQRLGIYMTEQLLLLSLLVLTESATRAASVKASFTPLFFMAEHSANCIRWLHGRCATEKRTEVSQCLDPPSDLEAFVILDHGLLGLCFLVIVVPFPQIALECNQDELDARAVLGNFCDPLGLDVFQGVGRIDLSSVSASMHAFQIKHTLKHSMMACVSS